MKSNIQDLMMNYDDFQEVTDLESFTYGFDVNTVIKLIVEDATDKIYNVFKWKSDIDNVMVSFLDDGSIIVYWIVEDHKEFQSIPHYHYTPEKVREILIRDFDKFITDIQKKYLLIGKLKNEEN